MRVVRYSWAALVGIVGLVVHIADGSDRVNFNREIRPILSNRCFKCHGPDENERQADLRLDTEEGAFADLGGHKAILPGKPAESALVRRIMSTDPSEAMPPEDSGKTLSPKERELLQKWVEQGAPYAQHWSYIQPARPVLPDVKDTAWPRNAIDPFILARLEQEGLRPSPEADRAALIRRVSLDLTGLPPTVEEVDRFAADTSENAYERLVDELLARPTHGEHWARMWLDLARYADSSGYADDPPRTIWAFRDYVIRSLNANKPFDQFTIEQIAGDLLPNPTEEQLIATAFHRNTMTNNEGGTNDEEFRNVALVDRVNTTWAVWMGTTMACAQCHNHKYDPVSQEDFFRFLAVLNNTEDADRGDEAPTLGIFSEEQNQQKAAWQAEIAELDAFIQGKRFAFTSGTPKLLGTPRKFAQYGPSGVWMSDALPNLQQVADELCVIRSMHTDQFNHAPAELLVYTGSPRPGRPSLGAWVTYGLGTENENLPGFVVLISSGVQPNGGKNSFGSGFLPSVFQGVQCRSQGDPVLYVSDPEGMDRDMRRLSLDALRDLNELQIKDFGHPESVTRIAQYELAFRMQMSVPEVMDISRESQQTLDAYGAKPGEASLANNCLLARRLVEQGVRYVQLFDWGWDFHGTGPAEDIRDGLTAKCATMDKPVAALIRDLKARGLLDETLIIWGGEFGRTPFREGRTAAGNILGRDHFPDCYTMFLAGGGAKRGFAYGDSDELGFSVASHPVHVHDLQATILHLLGFDHERLTFRFQGRDYRLTDVHGRVVKDLLA